jgi:hypothetical protein
MKNKDDLLARAEDHIFSTGLRDGGTQLCRANMKYGLAKIHWAQEQFGLGLERGYFGRFWSSFLRWAGESPSKMGKRVCGKAF